MTLRSRLDRLAVLWQEKTPTTPSAEDVAWLERYRAAAESILATMPAPLAEQVRRNLPYAVAEAVPTPTSREQFRDWVSVAAARFEEPLTAQVDYWANQLAPRHGATSPGRAGRVLALPDVVCRVLIAHPREAARHWPYDCAGCGLPVPTIAGKPDDMGRRMMPTCPSCGGAIGYAAYLTAQSAPARAPHGGI
jgi:hypothetical protein